MRKDRTHKLLLKIRTRDDDRNHDRELLIDDEVVSSLTVIDYQMRIGTTQVRMGGIGGVETKENHRMKGYMRKLMEDSVEYMKNEGYDVSVLFGLSNFYTKFGYAACLPSHKLTISTRDAEDSKNAAKGYKIRKIEKEDINSVLELYNENNQSRTCSIVRIKKHFSGFPRGTRYQQPTDDFLIVDDKQLLAYAVFDKSEQGVNVVEVESREDRLFPTLLYEFVKRAIERRCGNTSFFMPPNHAFAQFIHRYGCELTTQYPKNGGGMMRIINQDSLFGKLQGELKKKVHQADIDNPISLQIKTDIGDTTIPLLGNQSMHSPEQERKYSLELSQDKLAQLVVGYRNMRDSLNDSDVKVSGDIEPLANLLFSGTFPYMWLADHF